MSTEIERKFLIPSFPEGFDVHPHTALQQGYLAIAPDGGEVRIRQQEETCTLTVKQGKGMSRREDEITISTDIFNSLWPTTAGRRIEKVRYGIPEGDLTIELDQYKGALHGLLVAEVEFPSEKSALAWIPPNWFGPEVTENSAYKNQSLALFGCPNRAPISIGTSPS